jgi:hypothetical protein
MHDMVFQKMQQNIGLFPYENSKTMRRKQRLSEQNNLAASCIARDLRTENQNTFCHKCDKFICFKPVVPVRNFSGVKNTLYEAIVYVVMKSA